MSAFVGDPALRRLARLKLRGVVRRGKRRFRTPSGAIFALLGIGLALLWLSSVVFTFAFGGSRVVDPARALELSRIGVFALFVLAVTGNFAHRGLYLPAQEIERLFSAPIDRSDVIRYRLQMAIGQSLIGGVILALLGATRLPTPASGAVGAVVLVATVAVVGQGLALSLGAFERRLPVGLIRNGSRIVTVGLAAAIGALFMLADELPDDVRSVGSSLPSHPVVVTLLRPFEPWARLLTAETTGAMLTWLGVCLALLVLFFEGVARLRVDFRELALANSADVAARMRRMRQGGIAGASTLKGGDKLKPVPFLFGRRPWGAVCWRKLVGMLRRARATLLFSIFMLAFLVASATAIARTGGATAALSGTVMIGLLGTLYMGSGLRFDFREDVERMDVLKALPMSATAVFVATLVPEVLLIIWLILLAMLAHAILVGADLQLTLIACSLLPPFAWIWLALDNAFFLIWPIRVVPGQDGALQNMGRASIFMVLRMVVLSVAVGLSIGLGFLLGGIALRGLDLTPSTATWIGTAGGWLLLMGFAVLTARFGGSAFRRFDPAGLD